MKKILLLVVLTSGSAYGRHYVDREGNQRM